MSRSGTVAKHLGLAEDATTIKGLLDEMKDGDERFTALGEKKTNVRAAGA